MLMIVIKVTASFGPEELRVREEKPNGWKNNRHRHRHLHLAYPTILVASFRSPQPGNGTKQ